jgi:hypothetical protein
MLALEVVPLPVTDIDRALSTQQVGFTLDVDYRPTGTFRVVQLTPPGSAGSIHLVRRNGSTPLRDLCLVTDDLETMHRELSSRGVSISAPRHKHPVDTWAGDWAPGLDSERRDYCSFADFADPDGNTGQSRNVAIGRRRAASITREKELEDGTILAARPSERRDRRPLSNPRAASREAALRRATSTEDARPSSRRLDRRQRECCPSS